MKKKIKDFFGSIKFRYLVWRSGFTKARMNLFLSKLEKNALDIRKSVNNDNIRAKNLANDMLRDIAIFNNTRDKKSKEKLEKQYERLEKVQQNISDFHNQIKSQIKE